MVREISAGGVVLRRIDEEWQMAVIEPQKESAAVLPGDGQEENIAKNVTRLTQRAGRPG